MSIRIKKVSFSYNQGTPFERIALSDLTFTINKGQFIGIFGGVGSGKTTLVQMLGGLIRPVSGEILVDEPGFERVGVVFQFPERQFFESTVYKDLSFPLKMRGMAEDAINERIEKIFVSVGMDLSRYRGRSPLDLSDGEKRKLAIASVLVLEREFLVLDDPFTGLDNRGQKEIISELKRLHLKLGISIIVATRDSSFIEKCEMALFLRDGRIVDKEDYPVKSARGLAPLVAALKEKSIEAGEEDLSTPSKIYERVISLRS